MTEQPEINLDKPGPRGREKGFLSDPNAALDSQRFDGLERLIGETMTAPDYTG